MSSIALIHSGKSFMPEIEAYQHYFDTIGLKATILINPLQHEMEPFDTLWFFMGIQQDLNAVNKKKFIVHEYCSASTPPLSALKDTVKKIINPKPNLRISLNAAHQGSVFPRDNVPLIIRRQGVHACFFEPVIQNKEYDFIYCGSASKMRNTDKWLRDVTARVPDKNIILVGNHEPGIMEQFKSFQNIHFEKAASITSLPAWLAKSRYAVNHVPDVYPFNIQPSTKLLEYYTAGCNIISNRYRWVNDFKNEKQAGIFFVNKDSDNLSAEKLEVFEFKTSDMSEYKWETIFNEMQLQRFLPL